MNIIELAEQAGMVPFELFKGIRFIEVWLPEIERFAALVAAQEREECAKIAAETVCDVHLPTGTKIYGSRVATAIRARGTI